MTSSTWDVRPGNRLFGITHAGIPLSTVAGVSPRKMLFDTSMRINVYGGSPNARTACLAYDAAAAAEVVKYLPSSPAMLRSAPID